MVEAQDSTVAAREETEFSPHSERGGFTGSLEEISREVPGYHYGYKTPGQILQDIPGERKRVEEKIKEWRRMALLADAGIDGE